MLGAMLHIPLHSLIGKALKEINRLTAFGRLGSHRLCISRVNTGSIG